MNLLNSLRARFTSDSIPKPQSLTQLAFDLRWRPNAEQIIDSDLRVHAGSARIRVKQGKALFTNNTSRAAHQRNAFDLVHESFLKSVDHVTKKMTAHGAASARKALQVAWKSEVVDRLEPGQPPKITCRMVAALDGHFQRIKKELPKVQDRAAPGSGAAHALNREYLRGSHFQTGASPRPDKIPSHIHHGQLPADEFSRWPILARTPLHPSSFSDLTESKEASLIREEDFLNQRR